MFSTAHANINESAMSRLQWSLSVSILSIAIIINGNNYLINNDLRDRLNVKVGMYLLPMTLTRLGENLDTSATAHIESFHAGGFQILIYLSAGCGSCDSNLARWHKLETLLIDSDSRMIILSQSPNKALAKYQSILSSPILIPMDMTELTNNHLIATPQTIVLDQHGKVRKVWYGEIIPIRVLEYLRTLSKSISQKE
jgi:hypothetical protein